MPDFGWTPYILTVKKIHYHTYDYSLLREVPESAKIIRTGSVDVLRLSYLVKKLLIKFNRDNINKQKNHTSESSFLKAYRWFKKWFLFPDPSLGWLPFALLKGLTNIKKHKIDIVMASVGPYTSAIIAYFLFKITKKPYILDFRDGWVDDPFLEIPTNLYKKAHLFLERKAILNAQHICVYGSDLQKRFFQRYNIKNISVITNGYDIKDFKYINPAKKGNSVFRIVFSGTIFTYHLDFLDSLYHGLKKYSGPEIELVFVGRMETRARLPKLDNALVKIHYIGYVSHEKSISYLLSADALLIALPKNDTQSYSGKIFEYLYTKKPIISFINSKGILSELLYATGHGEYIVEYNNPESFVGILHEINRKNFSFKDKNILQFDRKNLTERVCKILENGISEK